ncbi:MAG: GNAT family N-acetyltransferase [Acidobacteriaceae bacterium]
MMHVDDGEHEPDLGRSIHKNTEQSHGVRAAGDSDGNAHAGAQAAAIERRRGCHDSMLRLILLNMLRTRLATPSDAALITRHRRRMFVDAGRRDDQVLQIMSEAHEPWVAKAITDGRYLGWITEDDGKVAAGAGLLLLDWPPHPLDPRSSMRGYLCNVYVEPDYRRRKLASNLIELALAEARRRGIRVVALHSTDEARRLYEANGFRATNEMFYVEPVEA